MSNEVIGSVNLTIVGGTNKTGLFSSGQSPNLVYSFSNGNNFVLVYSNNANDFFLIEFNHEGIYNGYRFSYYGGLISCTKIGNTYIFFTNQNYVLTFNKPNFEPFNVAYLVPNPPAKLFYNPCSNYLVNVFFDGAKNIACVEYTNNNGTIIYNSIYKYINGYFNFVSAGVVGSSAPVNPLHPIIPTSLFLQTNGVYSTVIGNNLNIVNLNIDPGVNAPCSGPVVTTGAYVNITNSVSAQNNTIDFFSYSDININGLAVNFSSNYANILKSNGDLGIINLNNGGFGNGGCITNNNIYVTGLDYDGNLGIYYIIVKAAKFSSPFLAAPNSLNKYITPIYNFKHSALSNLQSKGIK